MMRSIRDAVHEFRIWLRLNQRDRANIPAERRAMRVHFIRNYLSEGRHYHVINGESHITLTGLRLLASLGDQDAIDVLPAREAEYRLRLRDYLARRSAAGLKKPEDVSETPGS